MVISLSLPWYNIIVTMVIIYNHGNDNDITMVTDNIITVVTIILYT